MLKWWVIKQSTTWMLRFLEYDNNFRIYHGHTKTKVRTIKRMERRLNERSETRGLGEMFPARQGISVQPKNKR